MKTVVCPSCGASATNLRNCEFCGSLFVRSYSVGYNIGNFKNIFYFQSISEAFEENLKCQENMDLIDEGDLTTTDIYFSKDDFLQGLDYIFQCPDSLFIAECFISIPTRPSIAVDFNPGAFSSDEWERLKKMEEIKFFSSYKDLNGNMGYVVDFGNDPIGAAIIISKVLSEIKNIGQGTPLFCMTEPRYRTEDFLLWVDNLKDAEIKAYFLNRMKKHTSKCFIATATMGDYNHPVVMDLRMFRDNWLLKRDWGVQFINWYYTHGPKAASVIEKSKFLKSVTFILVVKPLQLITKLFR